MSNNNWHRLAPVALLFYFFRTIKQIAAHGTQSIAPLAVVVFSSDHKLFAILTSLLLACLAILIAAFLQYWFFRYCILSNEIQIKYGVFKKQHRIVKFNRVQNTEIKLPFYFKPFKMVVLAIDTAGSSDDEANLAGISKANAQQLRDNILSHKNHLNPMVENDTDDEQSQNTTSPLTVNEGEVIANASVKELAYYGFTNNQALFLAAIFTPFLEKFIDEDSLLNFKPFIDPLSAHLGNSVATFVVMLATILLMFSLIQIISIISAIIIHYNFKLTMFNHEVNSPQKVKLISQGGLFSQYQKALDLSKVQQVRQQASWQGKLLKVENLICHQIGSKKQNENLIIPARNKIQSHALLAKLLPDLEIKPPQQLISKHFLLNKAFRFVFVPCILIFIVLLYVQPPTITGFALSLIPMILLPFIYLYWHKFRFDFYLQDSTDGNNINNEHSAINSATETLDKAPVINNPNNSYLVITKGLIGYTTIYIPLYKIQSVQLQQTVMQKRRNLANLRLYLATGSYTIAFIPMSLAQTWFERINYFIHTSDRPWY